MKKYFVRAYNLFGDYCEFERLAENEDDLIKNRLFYFDVIEFKEI